jgi:hypothetical protein
MACDLKTMSSIFGVKVFWNALDYWSGFNDTEKGKKIKSTMCVFGKIIWRWMKIFQGFVDRIFIR